MSKVDLYSIGLKPQYTFENFVVGPHNQMASAASLEVTKKPGEAYNPLFIYGGPGVGKTHLIQAVAHTMLQKNPKLKIKYISAERFASEVIAAISEDNTMAVRQHYSDLDLLILDDIQFIAESKATQGEFFHIFNNLHEANRQVIIAGDRPPNQLTMLDQTIRSRLEWGLSVDIKVPDVQTRFQILKMKEAAQGLSLNDQILQFAANHLHSNVRELEGFLKRLHAYVALSHQELNMNLVQQVIREILPTESNFQAASFAPQPSAKAPPPPPPPPSLAPPPQPPAPLPTPPSVKEPAIPPMKAAPVPPDALSEPVPQNGVHKKNISEITSGPPPVPEPIIVGREEYNGPSSSDKKEIPPPMKEPAPSAKMPEPDVKPMVKISPTEVTLDIPPDFPEASDADVPNGYKEIGAVFFFPELKDKELETVHRKFQDVIKKHKLKFRLKKVFAHGYPCKGKINYSSFVDICKQNKVPVAIVIGPPPDALLPEQDFYDLLSVTLDVQGVSLQLVNWAEIEKDYRYLNLALDIALVRSR